MTTARKLRVLMVEASADDARRTLAKLEQSGYTVEHVRVDNATDMQSALHKNSWQTHGWDAVLCSLDPAGFCGLEALRLLQDANVALPFLFLSHDVSEESIVSAMHAGADDYIFKDNLSRLAPAIEHRLREMRVRLAHNEAQQALQEHQARLHAFIANLPGMAYQLVMTVCGDMSFPYISEGSLALLGLDPQELEHNPNLFLQMLHPDDTDSYLQSMRSSADSLSFWNWEGRVMIQPASEVKWINLRCSPRMLSNGDVHWEGIMSNITQSRVAEMELKASREQLRELSSHIQDVREQERLSIAREIHDDMGGTLAAIKLDMAWMGQRLTTQNPELLSKAKGIDSLVDRCITSANNISRALRPSALDSFGIIAALELEGGEFEKRTGIRCSIHHSSQDVELNPDISIALFRIFQETLTNIMKHAHASQVKVDIRNHNNGVDLIVNDNGRGIREEDRLKPRSFGLRGMQERIAHFNGQMQISSIPGQGTTIAVHIPHADLDAATYETLPQQTLF